MRMVTCASQLQEALLFFSVSPRHTPLPSLTVLCCTQSPGPSTTQLSRYRTPDFFLYEGVQAVHPRQGARLPTFARSFTHNTPAPNFAPAGGCSSWTTAPRCTPAWRWRTSSAPSPPPRRSCARWAGLGAEYSTGCCVQPTIFCCAALFPDLPQHRDDLILLSTSTHLCCLTSRNFAESHSWPLEFAPHFAGVPRAAAADAGRPPGPGAPLARGVPGSTGHHSDHHGARAPGAPGEGGER